MNEKLQKELTDIHQHFTNMKSNVDNIIRMITSNEISLVEMNKAFEKIDSFSLLFMAENYVLSTPPDVYKKTFSDYSKEINRVLTSNIKMMYERVLNPNANVNELNNILDILKDALEKASKDKDLKFDFKILDASLFSDPNSDPEPSAELGSNPELENTIASQIAEMFNDENKN
jgi:hypothetical protein